jgi:cation:H+ antiporter
MDILLTLGGLLLLVFGAEIMVRGAVELALRARISPLVVGLTVVSMGTSAPELLVSLLAALKGSSTIAIGNVVGSNIANISMVLGACILIYPIEVDRDAYRIHWPVMMLVTLLFTAMLWNDDIAFGEGALLVLLLLVYVIWMIRASRKAADQPGTHPVKVTTPLWRSLVFVLAGIAGLAFGADLFVEGAVGIARTLGVSEQLIGVTIVAVGTSMPELVTSLLAALRKQSDISIGNLVGSNIFNLLGIIGISAMVLPISVDHTAFLMDLAAMAVIALLLYPLMRMGNKLGRWQGALLLIAYTAYVVMVIQRG